MTDLRTAAEQEPVAWGVFEGENLHDFFTLREEAEKMAGYKGLHATVMPLYTAPPQRPAEPVQEPSGWFESPHGDFRANPLFKQEFPSSLLAWQIPLFIAPPQRPFVGLTVDERRGIREWKAIQKELGPEWAPMMLYLYEAIEAALREKNT